MTDFTLEERGEFESLLHAYANACIDEVHLAQQVRENKERRHRALHTLNDYVNARTKKLVEIAKCPPPPIFAVCDLVPVLAGRPGCECRTCVQANLDRAARVPVGTSLLQEGAAVVAHAKGIYSPISPDDIAAGRYHLEGSWVPVKNCSCRTCVECRANNDMGPTPIAPIHDTSGGN